MTEISSPAIDALLAKADLEPDVRASVHPCEASKFHSPRPLLTRQYVHGERQLWLCGVCADNLGAYLRLNKDNSLTWTVLREFGNEVRRIGQEIMKAAAEAQAEAEARAARDG